MQGVRTAHCIGIIVFRQHNALLLPSLDLPGDNFSSNAQVSGFYKYNSAAREFREVHSKSLGKTTDAVSMEPTRLKRPKGLVNQ